MRDEQTGVENRVSSFKFDTQFSELIAILKTNFFKVSATILSFNSNINLKILFIRHFEGHRSNIKNQILQSFLIWPVYMLFMRVFDISIFSLVIAKICVENMGLKFVCP